MRIVDRLGPGGGDEAPGRRRLAHLVARLTEEMTVKGEGFVLRAGDLLGDIATQRDPACIGMLLSLLDDDTEFHEEMFGFVHLIEMFDDETYVREIIGHLPLVWSTAPEWAAIIVLRMMNVPECVDLWADLLRFATSEQRGAARAVLQAVRARGDRFHGSCDRLLALL